MTPLRVGFLLPRYHQPSRSHLPAAMRILAEWGVTVEVIHPRDGAVDLSTVRVEHDLYVFKKISGPAASIAGVLHALGAAMVNPYPATMALRDKVIASHLLQAAGANFAGASRGARFLRARSPQKQRRTRRGRARRKRAPR